MTSWVVVQRRGYYPSAAPSKEHLAHRTTEGRWVSLCGGLKSYNDDSWITVTAEDVPMIDYVTCKRCEQGYWKRGGVLPGFTVEPMFDEAKRVQYGKSLESGMDEDDGLGGFQRWQLMPETLTKIENSTQVFRDVATVVKMSTGESRERSLALTKLQEAKMWANEAIVQEAQRNGWTVKR